MKKNTRTSWAVLVVAVLMFSRAASAQYSKIDLSFDETPPAAGQNETINLNFPTALQPEPTVYLFYVLGAAPCATPLACLGNFIPIGLGTLDEFNYAATTNLAGLTVSFFFAAVDSAGQIAVSEIGEITVGAVSGSIYRLDAVFGDDTNDCSVAAPCQTLTRAQSVVQSGDVVLLEGGNYAKFSWQLSGDFSD